MDRELVLLKAVKNGRRMSMNWKTKSKIYAHLRSYGLIVRKGTGHTITEKGERFLHLMDGNVI